MQVLHLVIKTATTIKKLCICRIMPKRLRSKYGKQCTDNTKKLKIIVCITIVMKAYDEEPRAFPFEWGDRESAKLRAEFSPNKVGNFFLILMKYIRKVNLLTDQTINMLQMNKKLLKKIYK